MLAKLFYPWTHKKIMQSSLVETDCFDGKLILRYNEGCLEISLNDEDKISVTILGEYSLWNHVLTRVFQKNVCEIKVSEFWRLYRKWSAEKQKIRFESVSITKDFERLYEDDIFLMQYPDSKYWYPGEMKDGMAKDGMDYYIHIPFCDAKCAYCDFAVTTERKKDAKQNYLKSLQKHFQKAIPKKVIPDTLYIGGGTPSVFTISELRHLFDGIQNHFVCSQNTEFSFEANPASLSREKIQFLKEGGVNRLSIGVQSFHPDILKKVGRTDTIDHIYNVLQDAWEFFENFNIDMMYGFAGQTSEELFYDLKELMEFKPAHITLYPLFVKKGSFFDKQFGKMPLQDVETLYRRGRDYLLSQGYIQYAREYFVKDLKYIHRYQDNYLAGKEVNAFGLRARSYIDGCYYLNPENFDDYNNGLQKDDISAKMYLLSKSERCMKDIVLGIKRNKLDISLLQKKYNYDFFLKHGAYLEMLQKKQLINIQGDVLTLTSKGLFYDNYIARGCI